MHNYPSAQTSAEDRSAKQRVAFQPNRGRVDGASASAGAFAEVADGTKEVQHVVGQRKAADVPDYPV